MRFIISYFFLLSTFTCYSQDNTFVKYYDSMWRRVNVSAAYFRTEFTLKDNYYDCVTYREKTGAIYKKASYKDTTFQKPLGLHVRYYENGKAEDSTLYNDDGTLKELFHYYIDGKLWAHCKQKGKNEVCEGYDEMGNEIPDFIYGREAEFVSGNTGWADYLASALSKFNPGKKGAPVGTYRVIVKFILDENGKVSGTIAETSFGFGMEEKAIEIIKRSPKWIPAIYLNKNVKAYRRQPLTFVVENE